MENKSVKQLPVELIEIQDKNIKLRIIYHSFREQVSMFEFRFIVTN